VKGRLKTGLRWVVWGVVLFFLGTVLRRHWQGVVAVRVGGSGWACLAIALGVTLLAHICAGWVWQRILYEFRQPVRGIAVVQGYLQTTIAKYLPGNVWHYYGRVTAARKAGASLETATVSVLLEPLLMAAAALVVTLISSQQIVARYGWMALLGQGVGLIAALAVVHPKVLNPLVRRLGKLKNQSPRPSPSQEPSISAPSIQSQPASDPASAPTSDAALFTLETYPWVPFLGELGFLLLRGLGFLLTVGAVGGFGWEHVGLQVPLILGAFSFAWLLGLVVPGAPGGIGVFEATAIALLGNQFAPGPLLSIVAVYRLISVLAEALGAGLATLDQRLWGDPGLDKRSSSVE
jgi:glycosyltransferase 2 family protein